MNFKSGVHFEICNDETIVQSMNDIVFNRVKENKTTNHSFISEVQYAFQ